MRYGNKYWQISNYRAKAGQYRAKAENTGRFQITGVKQGKAGQQTDKKRFDPFLSMWFYDVFCLGGFMLFVCFYVLCCFLSICVLVYNIHPLVTF